MALDGNEDHDQARSKAMLETAFQSDAFEPKRVPNPSQRFGSNVAGWFPMNKQI